MDMQQHQDDICVCIWLKGMKRLLKIYITEWVEPIITYSCFQMMWHVTRIQCTNFLFSSCMHIFQMFYFTVFSFCNNSWYNLGIFIEKLFWREKFTTIIFSFYCYCHVISLSSNCRQNQFWCTEFVKLLLFALRDM